MDVAHSLNGRAITLTEESYTSKASVLDLDEIATYDPKRDMPKPTFSGKREHRGLYRAKDGRRINADVQGSMNIMRKVIPNSYGHGIEVRAVAPIRFPLLTAQSRALTETASV
jgi:putative transposase